MAFPLDTPPDGQRRRLADLRNGLLHLHTVLMGSERAAYDRDVQRIRSQHQLLDLLLNDPAFAWLRELSGLIVLIDERLDADELLEGAEAGEFVARARALLSPGETAATFGARYLQALQRDPDVVLAHAGALKLLRELE